MNVDCGYCAPFTAKILKEEIQKDYKHFMTKIISIQAPVVQS